VGHRLNGFTVLSIEQLVKQILPAVASEKVEREVFVRLYFTNVGIGLPPFPSDPRQYARRKVLIPFDRGALGFNALTTGALSFSASSCHGLKRPLKIRKSIA
jgi:hypothetical protein